MKNRPGAGLIAGKEVWKQLEKIIADGHSRDRVFRDWLDLMLSAMLSLTDNVRRHEDAMERLKANQFDGKYEDRYMAIVERYKDHHARGERPIDYFSEAANLLVRETVDTRSDVLGEIYMDCITFGEHGQYFTPEAITDVMAQITGIESGTVSDPACGSGRTLISVAKQNPDGTFYGADLDQRCAMMCAINMHLLDLNAEVLCGNSLSLEFSHGWRTTKGGWITEFEVPRREEKQEVQEEQAALF